MKAKFGAIVVDGRGKLGGHVASKNKSGAFFRTKVTPTNPRTPYQTAVRATLQFFAQAWAGTLTEGERSGWIGLAERQPFNNIFGDAKFVSGINFYTKLNGALQNAGLTPISTAPGTLAPADVTAGALTLTAGMAGTGTIAFTTSDATSAHKIQVYATNNLSQGVNFVKSQLRYIGTYSSGTSPADFAADWRTKFGADGFVAGKKIFVAILDIEVATGAQSIPQIVSAIVP
jgi:hypothetical protein